MKTTMAGSIRKKSRTQNSEFRRWILFEMRWPGEGDHQPHHDARENGHQRLPPEADGEEAKEQIAGGVPVPVVVAEEEDEEEYQREERGDSRAFPIHDP